jgi:PAS domain S-box-containing protein
MGMTEMTLPLSQGIDRGPQWQALLDSAGEGIWGLDLEGNCTFINRMATKIFGFASDEIVGSNMHELVHHHYPDGRHFPGSECPIYNVVQENKSFRQMMDTMFRKDGSSFVAEISAQPVTLEGRVAAAGCAAEGLCAGRAEDRGA